LSREKNLKPPKDKGKKKMKEYLQFSEAKALVREEKCRRRIKGLILSWNEGNTEEGKSREDTKSCGTTGV